MKNLALACLAFALALAGSSSTAQATVTLTLVPSASKVALGGTLTLTATVAGTTNLGLTWTVNGVKNGSAAQGTLTACTTVAPLKCKYTAPLVDVPSPNPVTFKIVSAADTAVTKTATATVTDSIAVTLTPATASVPLKGTHVFTATLSGTTNSTLDWYVNGVLNGNTTQGTLTACTTVAPRICKYTAPTTNVPSPNPAVIKVASAADPSKNKTAKVTVTDSISVTLTPATASVPLKGTQVFTATLSGTTNTTLDWYVNGVLNGDAAQGTLTACTTVAPRKCKYTAPTTDVPSPNPAVIKVASAADPSKNKTAKVTVTPPPLAITTTAMPTGFLGLAYSAQLEAAGGEAPYTWTVAPNALPSGLTLDSATGVISGLPSGSAGSKPVIFEVKDNAGTLLSSPPLELTIDPSTVSVCESGNEAVLNGLYAFNLIGYTSTGFKAVVGSLDFNGAGGITNGEVDINRTGASAELNTTLPAGLSTYTVGADNRGCATIDTTAGGTYRIRFSLGEISSGKATAGRVIEYDLANAGAFVASGQILQQNAATFSAGPTGPSAHLLTGWDAFRGTRIACAGVLTKTPTVSGGNVTGVEQTCNNGAAVTTIGPTSSTVPVGTYTAADAHGRFTESTDVDSTPSESVGYLFPGGALLLSISFDRVNELVNAGEALKQVGPFSNSSLGDGTYIYYMNGPDGSSSSFVDFGLAKFTKGSSEYLDTDYQNLAGTWDPSAGPATCSFSVAATGMITTSDVSGCLTPPTLYMVSPSQAFLVSTNTMGVGAGESFLQTAPADGFTTASMVGAFYGGTTEVVHQDAKVDDYISILNGSSVFPNLLDIADKSSTTSNQPDSVGEDLATVASNGTITGESTGSEVVGIAINTSSFILATHTNGTTPVMALFNPSVADSVKISITSPTTAETVDIAKTLPITVEVTGTTHTNVTLLVNGVAGGNAIYGTVTGSYPSFTYNAPSNVPSPAAVDITAVSDTDVSKTASVAVTIAP